MPLEALLSSFLLSNAPSSLQPFELGPPRTMRIGHYTPKLWMDGGVATYIRRTGCAQADRNHKVVYFSHPPTDTSKPYVDDFTEVSDDAALFTAADEANLDVLHLHRSVKNLPEDRVTTVRTVHGHQGGCPSRSRYLSRTGMPCDRSFSMTGCLWGHFVDRCGSIRPQELKKNFTGIHREIDQAQQIPTSTVSQFLKQQMLQAGCSSDHLCTIRSPAPPVRESPSSIRPSESPRFLFLGRLVPEKGLDWLLRAVARTDEDLHLDVAGKGPKRTEYETLAEELGIRSVVSFHGWVEQERVASLMGQSRAVVFPSVWHEPAGLVTLEAAAHGRPLIASRAGGIPEYADDRHAILVDVRDVERLAQAMDRLAANPERALRMGRAGQEVAETDFSMSRFLDRLHEFYEHAQQNARPV